MTFIVAYTVVSRLNQCFSTDSVAIEPMRFPGRFIDPMELFAADVWNRFFQLGQFLLAGFDVAENSGDVIGTRGRAETNRRCSRQNHSPHKISRWLILGRVIGRLTA